MFTEVITDKMITYEQPLNESMRICLRLEHLFNQLQQHITQHNVDSSRIAVSALAKTLDVINRPDLKSKLSQMLTQHATMLAQLEQFSQVNPERLREILDQLDQLISSFHQQKNRIGERLRNNEFINQIRLREHNPGGACAYSSPSYALWLKKPPEQRIKDLKNWATEFSELRQIVELTLYLTRNSSEAQKVMTKAGFYQQNLDSTLPCEIIRVNVPLQYNVFPEFSVGRHRLAIRFLNPCYQDDGHPTQIAENIEFELTCCRV